MGERYTGSVEAGSSILPSSTGRKCGCGIPSGKRREAFLSSNLHRTPPKIEVLMSYGMRIKVENRVRALHDAASNALKKYLKRKKRYARRLQRRLWKREMGL